MDGPEAGSGSAYQHLDQQRYPAAPMSRVRARAEAGDGGVLQLRRLLHDHLDPLRMSDPDGYGMIHGGPPTMLWGWLLVGGFTLLVGMAMAEVCSSYPTAGGLYYWAAKLAPDGGPVWSWFTGWFNLLGQVAVTAGIDFGLSFFIGAFLNLVTDQTYWTSPGHVISILAVVLFVHGLLNTLGVRLVALLNDISVYWHIIGVVVIVVALIIAPRLPHSHQTSIRIVPLRKRGILRVVARASRFARSLGLSAFVFLLGLLNAQYTFTGYDASAHMTEETVNAARSGPRGIVNSIWVSLVAGFFLLLGVSMAIPTIAFLRSERRHLHRVLRRRVQRGAAGGHLPERGREGRCRTAAPDRDRSAVLLRDVVGDGELSDDLRVVLRRRHPGLSVLAPDQQADPDADEFDLVRGRAARSSSRAAYLKSAVAYFAVTSIAVIGLYIAYVLPVLGCGLGSIRAGAVEPRQVERVGRVDGDHLGRLHLDPVHASPVQPDTRAASFNYAPIAVGVVLILAGGWYLLSARKWFKARRCRVRRRSWPPSSTSWRWSDDLAARRSDGGARRACLTPAPPHP